MQNDEMTRAVDSLAYQPDPSIFVAENGLRLKLKRVSRMVVGDAAMRFKAPKPPRTFNDAKGREEENPNDPDYLADMIRYRYDIGMISVSTYFVLGTQVHGELPSSLEPVSADGWVEQVKAADPGADIPTSGPRRYLAWLKYYALSDEDVTRLLRACVRHSGGTLEADVAAAQATFRDQQARDPANGVSPADGGGFRDYSGANSGNGARVRSEGSSGVRPGDVGPVDPPVVF